mmetsp:Transcript_129846/g.315409  ORF Transcript_129846/g.315409 Transcript_129846/m.315409 type:complete len:211 (+) Transcript_129846:1774-2406(+)
MRLTSASPLPSCWTKLAVPERAMRPRFSMSSSLDMPTPLSSMVRVRLSLSVLMRSFMGSGGASLSVRARKRFLSHASAALETSSRKNTSLFEYREFTMMSMTFPTSAWKSKVSTVESVSVATSVARRLLRCCLAGFARCATLAPEKFGPPPRNVLDTRPRSCKAAQARAPATRALSTPEPRALRPCVLALGPLGRLTAGTGAMARETTGN